MFNLFLIGLLALTPEALASEDGIIVVLNQRNPTQNLDRAELKAIYLGNTSFWHGVVPMKVFSQPSDSKATSLFIEGLLGISFQRYRQSWSTRELSGQGVAPTELSSAEQVIAEVRKAPGGIGFLKSSAAWTVAPEGVKFIEVSP